MLWACIASTPLKIWFRNRMPSERGNTFPGSLTWYWRRLPISQYYITKKCQPLSELAMINTCKAAFKPDNVGMIEWAHSLGLLCEICFKLGILQGFLERDTFDSIKIGWGIEELRGEEYMTIAPLPEFPSDLEMPFFQYFLALFLILAPKHRLLFILINLILVKNVSAEWSIPNTILFFLPPYPSHQFIPHRILHLNSYLFSAYGVEWTITQIPEIILCSRVSR